MRAKKPLTFVGPAPGSNFRRSVHCDAMQELNDEIITTGSIGIHARLLRGTRGIPTDDELETLVLQEAYGQIDYHGDTKTEGLGFTTSVKPYSHRGLVEAARRIAVEVNVFTNAGGHETRRKVASLREILKGLPLDSNVRVLTARTSYNDEDGDIERHLTVTVFLNLKTRKAVTIYTREGTM